MYHPSSPWYAQLALLSDFKCDVTLVPTGASGALLKSKLPNRYAHEDNAGFTLELRSRFKVIYICGSNWSHSLTGKFGSAPAKLASKWFLKVLITLSAEFRKWIWGGTSWYLILFLCKLVFISVEASLPIKYIFGSFPPFVSFEFNFNQPRLIFGPALFFRGSVITALLLW